jgi:hypothetical protein
MEYYSVIKRNGALICAATHIYIEKNYAKCKPDTEGQKQCRTPAP